MVRDTAIGKFVNSFYIPIVPLPEGKGYDRIKISEANVCFLRGAG